MTDLLTKVKAALEGTTPGPWEIPDHKFVSSLTVNTVGGLDAPLIRCPGTGGAMSYTDEVCKLSWSGTDEWLANARLIALAPDMARALIAAERLANAAAPYAHKTEGLDHGLHVALAAFRAAMEGRTNG